MLSRHPRAALAALLLLAVPALASAQVTQFTRTDTITANADEVVLPNSQRQGTASIEISGTWVGTIAFQVLGTTWGAPIPGCTNAAGSTVTSATANGKFICPVSAWASIKALATAWTSGTATVRISFGPGGGSSTGGAGASGDVNITGVGGNAVTTTVPVNCTSGCAGGTTDTDDASVAGGQSTGLSIGLSHAFDGTVWRRVTFGTAGTASAQVTTIQGIASMTPVQVSQATAASLNATVVGTGTFAVQAAQSGTWNIGSLTTFPDNEPFNLAQIAGTTAATGNGVVTAGTARVAIASDSNMPLPSGAATAANQTTGNTSLGTIDTDLGTAAAAADDTANPTLGGLRTFAHFYDGTTWDRVRGTSADGLLTNNSELPAAAALTDNFANPTTTILAAAMMCWDGSAWDRCTNSTDATQNAAAGTAGPQVMHRVTTDIDALTVADDGDAVRPAADTLGRQVTLIGCNRENRVRGAATITDGSSTSVLAAGGAGKIYEIYEVEIVNTSGTDVSVDLRDGTAGSVLWTLMAPATTDTGGGNNRTFSVPLTFTANTAVAADPSASATSIIVSVLGCSVQ
jgi:hypothetical protein